MVAKCKVTLFASFFESVANTFVLDCSVAPVVQRMDKAIHRINHYPVDSIVGFVNTYPLDRLVIYPVDSAIHPLNRRGQ